MSQRPRYDSNRVKLRTGEYQKLDGHYEYRYTVFGKTYSVYAKNLETLREKESEIQSLETAKQAKFDSRTTTLNDVFYLWKELKRAFDRIHSRITAICTNSMYKMDWSGSTSQVLGNRISKDSSITLPMNDGSERVPSKLCRQYFIFRAAHLLVYFLF